MSNKMRVVMLTKALLIFGLIGVSTASLSTPLEKKICTSTEAPDSQCYSTAEQAGDYGCREFHNQTFVGASPGGSVFVTHVISCEDSEGQVRAMFGADPRASCKLDGEVPISDDECGLPIGGVNISNHLGVKECPKVSNPISLSLGNKIQTVTLNDESKASLDFNLYYNSADDQKTGQLGLHWSSSYSERIVFSASNLSLGVVLTHEDGRSVGYTYSVDSESGLPFYQPNSPTSKLINFIYDSANPVISGNVTINNILGWRVSAENGVVEEYNKKGLMVKRVWRNGRELIISHNEYDLPFNISDNQGKAYQINYQSLSEFSPANPNATSSAIESITNESQQEWTFEYSDEEILNKVSYPDTTSEIFHFENTSFPTLLTGLTDRNGVRFVTWTYDAEGRANSGELAGGVDHFDINYDAFPQVSVTNPLGKQTTYHFEKINGLNKLVQVEGHQSTGCAAANKFSVYDDNANLISVTDWQGNITEYFRDGFGRVVREKRAVDSDEERVLLTVWHPEFNTPQWYATPGRLTEFSYDLQGRVTRQESYRDQVDLDGDGLSEYFEFLYFGDTNQIGSGDADGDGLSNAQELADQTNPADNTSGGTSADTDGDGLPDNWEVQYYSTILGDGSGDQDGDGLTDKVEFLLGSDPSVYVFDSDNDAMSDGWEYQYFLSLNRDGFGDFDQDGIRDLQEYTLDKNPVNRSDGIKPIAPHFTFPIIGRQLLQ